MDNHVYKAKSQINQNKRENQQVVKEIKQLVSQKTQKQSPKNSRGKQKRVEVSKQELIARMKRNVKN